MLGSWVDAVRVTGLYYLDVSQNGWSLRRVPIPSFSELDSSMSHEQAELIAALRKMPPICTKGNVLWRPWLRGEEDPDPAKAARCLRRRAARPVLER
jgi:hypothetical protein